MSTLRRNAVEELRSADARVAPPRLSRPPLSRRGLVLAGIGFAVLGLAACGGSGATAGSGASISIVAPTDGATVTQPFSLTVRSSAELGPTDTGKDHFHLSFDGNSQQYTVQTSSTVAIDELSLGKHTIHVSLQHADHSPVGPTAQVTVTVARAGSGGGTAATGGGQNDGY